MRRAESIEAFLHDPLVRWIATSTSVTWCSSPTLAGVTVWGAPDGVATRAILRTFDALWAPTMADQIDVIADVCRVERIDPEALHMVVEWNVARRDDVRRRIRQQIGVIRSGLVGITLSGVLPTVGDTHPFRVMHDPLAAHREFPGADDIVGREVEEIVQQVSGETPELRALRELLRARHAAVTLAECARSLGTSTRTLQRALGALGTSFQRELHDARFTEAKQLLSTTDEKVATIARRVGVTESALAQLVRERTGRTPAELRRLRDG